MFKQKSLFILCFAVILVFRIVQIHAQDGGQLIKHIMYQEFDKAKALVENGVDVNYQDKSYGSTALILACQYGFVDMAKYLVEKGADVNLQAKNGHSPLIASAGVSQELMEYLLSKGADVKLKDETGRTAFTHSITGVLMERVTTDAAELLLKKGADVDEAANTGRSEGYTCLMMAARNQNPELVKFLVKNGADVNAKAKDGMTPLKLAEKEKDTEMVKLLKKLGAK